MISLCFSNNSLYSLFSALSSSNCCLSFSISKILFSYSFNWFFNAVWNWGVSSILCPPVIICSLIIWIFFSNFNFSSLSIKYCREAFSNSLIASFLSCKACSFSSCNCITSPLFFSILFFSSNSFFKFFNSFSYFLIKALLFTSSFIIGLFFIFFALWAKYKVDRDSLKASWEGLIIAIIVVLQFPPRESWSNLVNFESLYGI